MIRVRALLTICLLLSICEVNAFVTNEVFLRQFNRDTLAIVDTMNIYERDNGATSLFYLSRIPKPPIKGVLVLMCGTLEPVEETVASTKELIKRAYANGIAVMIPSINQRLVMTDEVLKLMNTFFTDAIHKYKLPKDKFVLGGWSMGGFFSTRYTAHAYEDSTRTVVKPVAVFNVDGPTDLANLYNKWNADLVNPRNHNKSEPTYAIGELIKYIGGTPTQLPDRYVYYSTFSAHHADGGTSRFLTHVPLRIYCDVDVNWWIANRGTDLYGINALDQSAMINYLIGAGNSKAEFINALGKGYRIDGRRHPHSWSIVDAKECVEWIRRCIDH